MSDDLQVGDCVEYTFPTSTTNILIVGKQYKVVEINGHFNDGRQKFCIINEKGDKVHCGFVPSHFKKVKGKTVEKKNIDWLESIREACGK